jgi:beta-phosphoglucomutase
MQQASTEHPGSGAVIWDMDGVIVDSAQAHRRAWAQLAQETGVTFSDDYFWQTFGMRNPEIIRPIWGSDLDDRQVRALADRKEQLFRDFVRTEITALPGALDLMRGLRDAGYRQALASSAPLANIALISETLGIQPLLDAIISGEPLPRGKPAPDIFLAAAAQLGVDAAAALVIEDAPAGVQAARAAGMRCIGVSWGKENPGLAPADLVVSSLEQVQPATVRRLLGV